MGFHLFDRVKDCEERIRQHPGIYHTCSTGWFCFQSNDTILENLPPLILLIESVLQSHAAVDSHDKDEGLRLDGTPPVCPGSWVMRGFPVFSCQITDAKPVYYLRQLIAITLINLDEGNIILTIHVAWASTLSIDLTSKSDIAVRSFYMT